MGKRVLVAMSGGVDSSLTAALLLDQGYTVHGVTMTMVKPLVGSSASCGASQGAADAKAVADILGFPHVTVDAADVFGREVLADFVSEYRCGRTPNPCVRCNRYVKFGFLMKTADELGCEMLATGHYAMMRDGELCRGSDRHKDQSYFLYQMYAIDSSRIMFPLGELTKTQVRERATQFGLPCAAKSESQDICFIPDGDYGKFLDGAGVRSEPGPLVNLQGEVVGRHTGIQNYTVGQRKGLGALGRPMFVKELRLSSNEVVVAQEHELMAARVIVRSATFGKRQLDTQREYRAQIRYRSAATPCVLSNITADSFEILFPESVRAPAPGQSAVVYDDDTVVAGGIIEQAHAAEAGH